MQRPASFFLMFALLVPLLFVSAKADTSTSIVALKSKTKALQDLHPNSTRNLKVRLEKLSETPRPEIKPHSCSSYYPMTAFGFHTFICTSCNRQNTYDVSGNHTYSTLDVYSHLIGIINRQVPDLRMKIDTSTYCPRCSKLTVKPADSSAQSRKQFAELADILLHEKYPDDVKPDEFKKTVINELISFLRLEPSTVISKPFLERLRTVIKESYAGNDLDFGSSVKLLVYTCVCQSPNMKKLPDSLFVRC